VAVGAVRLGVVAQEGAAHARPDRAPGPVLVDVGSLRGAAGEPREPEAGQEPGGGGGELHEEETEVRLGGASSAGGSRGGASFPAAGSEVQPGAGGGARRPPGLPRGPRR